MKKSNTKYSYGIIFFGWLVLYIFIPGKTFSNLAIGNNARLGANICAGSDSVIIHSFSVASNNAGDGPITSFTFKNTGTWVAGEITKFMLFTTPGNTFTSPTFIASINSPSVGDQTFSSISIPIASSTKFLWITMDVATSVTDSNTITASATGNNDIVPNAAGFNSSAPSGTQTLRVLPTATISYAGNPFCATGSVLVSQNGQPGGNYSASGGLALNTSTGQINLGASTPNTYVVTYSFTDGTCPNTTTTSVTINPLPIASINYVGNPFCGTGNVTVNQTGQPGGTYTAPPGLTINSASGTINLSTSVIGIYIVTYTFTDGTCSNSTSTSVTIDSTASVAAGLDQTICAGSTVFMSGSFGGGASSATWSTSGSGTFNNNNPNAVYTPSTADTAAGSVSLIYTTNDPPGNTCTAASDTMILTIDPRAIVNAGSNQTICAGSTANMNGSFGGGASSATWSTSGSGTFNNNNPNAVYTPSNSDTAIGIVTLAYTTNDPSGPCPAVNSSMTLTINPAAVVNAGLNQTICAGSTANMNGSFGGGASSATWSTSGSGTFNNNNPNAVYTPSNSDTAIGMVTLTYTTNDPSGPCPAVNSSMTLTINPAAVVNAGLNQTICAGSTATMSGLFGGSADSAVWSTSGTGTFNNNNPNAVYTPSNSDTTIGSVTLTYATNDPLGICPSVNSSMTLTMNPEAVVNAGSNQTICAGSTAQMNGSFGGGASSALWSSNGTGTFNNNNPNAVYTPSNSDTAIGNVTLTYITNDPSGPCPAVSSNMTLTINPAAAVNAGPNQTICAGSNATMNGSFGGSTDSAVWSTNGTGTFNNNNPNAVYIPSNSDTAIGSVTLTYTTNDPSGPCSFVNSSMILSINPSPANPSILSSIFDNIDTLCTGSSLISFVLDSPVPGDIINYNFSPPIVAVKDDSLSGNAVITTGNFSGTGLITVEYENTFGCTSASTFNFFVSSSSAPAQAGVVLKQPGNLLIYLQNNNSGTVDSYQWGFDDANNGMRPDTLEGETFQVFPVPASLLADSVQKFFWVIATNISGNDKCPTKVYYNGPYKNGYISPPVISENITASVLPNPNNGTFTLMLSGDIFGSIEATIMNTLGQVVSASKLEKTSGIENFPIAEQNLARGIYMMNIRGSNGENLNVKLLVD